MHDTVRKLRETGCDGGFASRLRILKSGEAFEISCGDQRGDRFSVSMKDDSLSLIGDSVALPDIARTRSVSLCCRCCVAESDT